MQIKTFLVILFGSFIFIGCFQAAFSQVEKKGEGSIVEEDALESEDDDVKVEDDAAGGEMKADVTSKDLDDEVVEAKPTIGPSPDAETVILFTVPPNKLELSAGKMAKFLVGLRNKGQFDFIVETLDTTLRYPLDYNYVIRNYTAAKLYRTVSSNIEATFDYAFIPPEDLAGRSFGLTVLLNYKDSNGSEFQSAVFNETIAIVEDESHFNPETGFLYLFFACLVILLLFLGQQFLQKMRRKHGIMQKKPAPVEMGTVGNADVDWEWIPKEYLISQTQKAKNGPTKRKNNRNAGSSGGSGSEQD